MEWRPIESAPREGSDILIGGDFSYLGGVVMASWCPVIRSFCDMEFNTYNPTHWMSLPDPPK